MVTLPDGRFWSFCCCAAVFGVIVLKPEATSMFSLFWVLLCVVAQPTVSANSTRALIIWNETICFIFLVLSTFAVVLEMISSAIENSRRHFRRFRGPVYKTLVQYVRVAERILASRISAVVTRDGEDVSGHPRQNRPQF